MAGKIRFNGVKLDPKSVEAIVAGTLIQGNATSKWWKRQSADFLDSFMDTIKESMNNGESLTQAITRITGGTIDGVFVPGILKTSKGKAGALAATAINAVGNKAALESFQLNADVIKWVTQMSTLDNRTSDVCIAYSGQTWDVLTLQPVAGSRLPFNGGPPRHFNCRSRLRPVTKSFAELGIPDLPELPPGTRASMNGQVPADITFDAWLKTKSKSFQDNLLGPARANLWRTGKITLTQLVDMRGNPMTLAQLEKRHNIPASKSAAPAATLAERAADPEVDASAKAIQDFNDKVASALQKGDTTSAHMLVATADDLVPAAVQANATKRINDAVEAAEKKAAKFMDALEEMPFATQQQFTDNVKSILALPGATPLVRKQVLDSDRFRKIEAKAKADGIIAEATEFETQGDITAALNTLKKSDDPNTPLIVAKRKELEKKLADAEKAADDLIEAFQKDFGNSVSQFQDAVESAAEMASPTLKIQIQNKLFKAVEEMELQIQKRVDAMPFEVRNWLLKGTDTTNSIPKHIVVALGDEIDNMAVLKNGVFDDKAKAFIHKKATDLWQQTENAIDEIKFLNKGSKGVNAIEEFVVGLPTQIRANSVFNDQLKKTMAQAQKKAKDARTIVIEEMFKDGTLTGKLLDEFEDEIQDALSNVHKKLGKQQLKGKIAQIKAIVSGEKGVTVTPFTPDATDYAAEVKLFLTRQQFEELEEIQQAFKKNPNDAKTRYKLFDALNGKTPEQVRMMKEFIHQRNNPKELRSHLGVFDWDEKVNEFVAMHKANESREVIQKKMAELLQEVDQSVITNFRQTVFTRTGVTKLDDLGVKPTPISQQKKVEAIRDRIKAEGDPMNTPITATKFDDELEDYVERLKKDGRFRGDKTSQQFFDEFDDWANKHVDNLSWPQLSRMGKVEDVIGVTKEVWDKAFKKMPGWAKNIVYKYTTSWYDVLTRPLYQGGTRIETMRMTNLMNRALEFLPKFSGTLKRGARSNNNWSIDYLEARYVPGEKVVERSFLSTSTGNGFTGNVTFIYQANGKRGSIVSPISAHTGEREIIFQAGTEFEVMKVDRNGENIKIWLKEVGP